MSTKKLQILDYNIKQAENADTLDGKHASEFGSASDVNDLQSKVGDISVATQITNAIAPINTSLDGKLDKSGGTMTGDIDMNGHNINNAVGVSAQSFEVLAPISTGGNGGFSVTTYPIMGDSDYPVAQLVELLGSYGDEPVRLRGVYTPEFFADAANKAYVDNAVTSAASSTTPKIAGTAAVGSETTFSRGDHVHPAQTTVSGNAGSATKWYTARNINGMSVDGSASRFNYGTCSTSAATVAKVVSCTGFTLATGSEITVKFTYANTASSPTLNVNSTGAKSIYYNGKAIAKGALLANGTYTFRYNGAQYDLIGSCLMTGATSSAAGTSGLVPVPASGKQNSFLRGDGTWAEPQGAGIDYVIEQGSTDGWFYRKWQSGRKECWKNGSLSNVAITISKGGCYRSTNYLVKFPFDPTDIGTVEFVQVTGHAATSSYTVCAQFAGWGDTNNECTIEFISMDGSSAQNVTVSYNIYAVFNV